MYVETFLSQFVGTCLVASMKYFTRDRIKQESHIQSKQSSNNNKNNNRKI